MRLKKLANTVCQQNSGLANAMLREQGGAVRLKMLRRKSSSFFDTVSLITSSKVNKVPSK
jgi:hypothetical protein